MEKLTRDKHSSLLPKFVNHGQKSFITWSSPNLLLKLVCHYYLFLGSIQGSKVGFKSHLLKHSSLFTNNEEESFIGLVPGRLSPEFKKSSISGMKHLKPDLIWGKCYKIFYDRNLQVFEIS